MAEMRRDETEARRGAEEEEELGVVVLGAGGVAAEVGTAMVGGEERGCPFEVGVRCGGKVKRAEGGGSEGGLLMGS